MQLEKIPLKDTGKFSEFFLDFLSGKETIKPLYNQHLHPDNFVKQIEEKKFDQRKREILVEVLTEQYSGIEIGERVKENLLKLENKNTFTVTTGHQLNIFSGPLYFIYKIITAINCCKKLNEEKPEYHFVPVYWMASEDHDFDEIKFIQVKGKKYTWQSDQKGAVGRFDPKSLAELADQIPGGKLFKNAYASSKSLSEAARKYVDDLFGEHGLIVLDPDHPKLKAGLKDVIKDDLVNHKANHLVNQASGMIEKLGYEPLVFPRKINFFYLEENSRSRIIKEKSIYKGVDAEWRFEKDEILNLAENYPEKFSPNVVMRPLYQELILPNLGYIGGPAEIVYWLQLKEVFNYYGVPFPILIPRNFVLMIPGFINKKIRKLGFNYYDLFQDAVSLKNKYAIKVSGNNLSLEDEKKEMAQIFSKIKNRGVEIDTTLGKHIAGESKKAEDQLGKIEKKFLKAERRKYGDQLAQIDSILEVVSPGGKLQERTENLLAFYYDSPGFIDQLLRNLDPFDPRFHILFEDD